MIGTDCPTCPPAPVEDRSASSNPPGEPRLAHPRTGGRMLNIGKLGAGGGEYYIGEIATSAEDYYTGHGEAAGRWIGTLAADTGLVGDVDPEHFRRVLLGQDPHTGETLIAS